MAQNDRALISSRLMQRRQFLKCAVLVAASPAGLALSAQPHRKTRAESYFGVHFDLHPNAQDTILGRDVTDAMVARFLDGVHPDFVQYDCKGHPGWMGYPSQVQRSAKMVRDSLAVWRKMTAERGVSLYIHFSGIWDYLAAEEHPDWTEHHADGKPDTRAMSPFGPYEERLMIPELLEAAETHSLDGAWVDGDCWALEPDYSPACADEFKRRTGIAAVPKSSQDPGWYDFLEVNREGFRRYVRKYVDALHAKHPGFQIASNWLYSTFVPEKPEIPVDFLSGDYLGNAAVSTARLQARYLAATGKTWDLMAWGFQESPTPGMGQIYKSVEELQQESCITLAQGGAFQVYYTPTRPGYIDERHVASLARVRAFVKAREQICHNSTAIPQAAVIYSGHSIYQTAKRPFGPWNQAEDAIRGLIDALVENHISVDVIPDWKIETAAQYPLVVVPEWPDLRQDAYRALVSFARQGSALLITGAENAKLFERDLGVYLVGDAREQPAFLPGREVFANVSGVWQDVESAGAEAVATRFPTYDSTREGQTAATLQPIGRGKILGVYGPLGISFAKTHAPETRHLVGDLVSRVFRARYAVSGPPTVEVALRAKNGRTYLHLVNCTGMQVAGDYSAIDFIPPVGPIAISGVKKATPMFEGQALQTAPGGELILPVLRVHEALEIG